MFKNIRVGIRLGAGFAVIIILMIIMLVISIVSMESSSYRLERIVNVNNVRIKLSYDMIDASREMSIQFRNIMLVRDRGDRRELIRKSIDTILEKRKTYTSYLDKMEEMIPAEDVRGLSLTANVKSNGETVKGIQDRIISMVESGRFAEATNETVDAYPVVSKWINSISELIKYNEDRNAMRYNQVVEEQEAARLWLIITGLIAVLGGALISFYLTKGIISPLKSVSNAANRIASGDLTGDIDDDDRTDEIGLMMQTMQKMNINLREQTRGIFEGINVLASSTSQVSATAKQLAASAQETLTSVSETTVTMEEVKQTSRIASQKATMVSEVSNNAVQISDSGRKSAEEFFAIMGKIREQMDFIANSIVKLSEQSQAIGLIIAAVNDLANQSNLLAVNASIEASKAGEHGKGFTVVAQEVRSLAEQSRDATNQVRLILNDIQKSISGAVMSTEQGKNAVDEGVRQSVDARESIRLMAEGIVKSAQASMQIMVSINEQVVGIDQVALAMDNIKKATEQIAESTRQSEDLSRNLNDLGGRMKQMVSGFRV